jgi:hypothetical protein
MRVLRDFRCWYFSEVVPPARDVRNAPISGRRPARYCHEKVKPPKTKVLGPTHDVLVAA